MSWGGLPGPRARTPLGQLFAVRRDVLGLLSTLAREYGDIAAFSVGPIKAVLLSHPDFVQHVLATNQRNFVKGRPLRLAKQLLGEGLLTSEGEFHARQSRIVSPSLHPRRLPDYGPDVIDSAARMSRRWSDGMEVDILDEMIHLAAAITAKTMFHWAMDSSEAAGIGQALGDTVNLFSRVSLPYAEWLLRLPLPSNRRFFRGRAHLHAVMDRLIAERRREGVDRGDLLSMLLAQDGGGNGRMTDRQVRDEALTLFLTGFDTVSLCLTWVWYALAQHPEVERTLWAELDLVLAGRPPNVGDLASLPYTRMVLSETLRLYPPIYVIAREAVETFSVGGYTIPAGTLVLLSPYLMHRDPRFHQDPERFDPSRWDPVTGTKAPRFSYFPFGGGPRGCVGQNYALQEAALVLATLAQHWQIRLVPGHPVVLRPLINLRPRGGIRMRLERRTPPPPDPGPADDAGSTHAVPAESLLPPRVRDLYPFAARFVPLSCGHRMHYLDEGTGPTLLMLHGSPTWSFHYRHLVLGLRSQYRCIVPDHLGCGLSDKPERWSYGIRDHTQNLCELLTKLDLGDITLVTHDWGGPIGYLAALRFPERFRRFITFNTAISLLALPRLLTMLRLPVIGPLVIRGLNGMVRAGLVSTALAGHRFDREVRAGYLAPYDSWAHRIAILRFVQEIPLEEIHPNHALLADLANQVRPFTEHPHLVIWGLKDPVFDRSYLLEWRRRFPGAEVHELENASHWVADEAQEQVLPLVRTFLARTNRSLT